MLSNIQVESFRSIKDSSEVELRPITVLVGKNSTGKSSFLRIFPLLKQTIEKNTSDPLLWYGDLVDFADFRNSSYFKSGNDITISLSLTIPVRHYHISEDKKDNIRNSLLRENVPVHVKVSIQKHYFKTVIIKIYDQSIAYCKDKRNGTRVYVNGVELSVNRLKMECIKENLGFLPYITVPGSLLDPNDPGSDQIRISVSDYFNSPSNPEKKYDISELGKGYHPINNISIYKKDEVLHFLKEVDPTKYENSTIDDAHVKEINNYFMISQTDALIRLINYSLEREFKSTSYIKPIRANAERYYRIQGVNINEMNSDGSNIPMILHNLSEKEKSDFWKWTQEKFGVSFRANPTGGHVSIVILDQTMNGKNMNLADTGYGFSQILPIIMILWMAQKKRKDIRAYNGQRIVIEQPELHLHPAMQAQLARAFAAIVKEAEKQGMQISILFETHSEMMINELGKLVSEGMLKQEDVNVLAFSKEEKNTIIRTCIFDKDGLLIGWPAGFFSSRA